MRFSVAPLLSLPLLALSGCIVAAVAVGAAAGLVVHETVIADDTVEAELSRPAGKVFPDVVSEMRELSTDAITIESAQRRVTGKYDGSDIVVEVRELGADHSILSVKSTKVEFATLETARAVQKRLQERIEDSVRSEKTEKPPKR
jgi:hypothetical protein